MNKDLKEILFCPLDLFRLFLSRWKLIVGLSLFLALAAVAYLIFRPANYVAQASFKEMADREESWSVKEFFVGSFSLNNSSQAATIMLSKEVLRPLIMKLGLQAQVPSFQKRFSKSFFTNFYENILAEFNTPLKDIDGFVFENVQYEKELSLSLFFSFVSEDSFELLDKDKNKIATCHLKERYQDKDIKFTLLRTPKNLILNKIYQLNLLPLPAIADSLVQKITVKYLKENYSVLLLTMKGRDRHLIAAILNELMEQYQNYLKKESDDLAKEQLSYLKKRQLDVNENLKNTLTEYENYLSKNLDREGFFTFGQEMDTLLSPHNKYHSQLFDIDLEIANLQKNRSSFSTQDGELNRLEDAISGLKNEKDLLSLSLLSDSKQESLKELQNKHQRIETIDLNLKKLETMDLNSPKCDVDEKIDKLILEKKGYLEERERVLLSKADFDWLKDKDLKIVSIREKREKCESLLLKLKTQKIKKEDLCLDLGFMQNSLTDPRQKKSLMEYLENFIYLLNVKERTLDSSFFYQEVDFDSLDLENTRKRYFEALASLEDLKNNLEQLSHAKEKLNLQDFEISSLGVMLNDSVSNSILSRAASLNLEMQDKKNRSEKDLFRIQEEVSIQKRFLALHLDELCQLNLLSQKITIRKIDNFRKMLLNLLNQEISLLEQRSERAIATKIANLNEEKRLLLDKTKEIQNRMQQLPLRWKSEKLLQLKTEMAMKMMQTNANLFESKNIARQLHQVLSKPLDKAIAPLFPKSPRLRLFFLFFWVLFIFLLFFIFFVKEAFRGFEISLEMLRASSFHISGYLSSSLTRKKIEYKREDLNTLREMNNLLSFQEKNKFISILANDGPNFSFHLANLLSKKDKKVLVIDCDFSKPSEKGLAQFLERETKSLNVLSEKGFDYLPAGGPYFFSSEILSSQKFSALLQDLKNKYDHLIFFSDSSFKSPEGKIFLKFSDLAFLTIRREKIDDLKKVQTNSYLSFVGIS